jgi:hypothetical protein
MKSSRRGVSKGVEDGCRPGIVGAWRVRMAKIALYYSDSLSFEMVATFQDNPGPDVYLFHRCWLCKAQNFG